MRKAESSVNQSYQGEELPLQAAENRKVKADKNYVYFKLSELMGDDNERENREFLMTTIHVQDKQTSLVKRQLTKRLLIGRNSI